MPGVTITNGNFEPPFSFINYLNGGPIEMIHGDILYITTGREPGSPVLHLYVVYRDTQVPGVRTTGDSSPVVTGSGNVVTYGGKVK